VRVGQRSLFDQTIDQKFAEFHAHNPNIYARIVELLREAQRAGRQRVGIKLLIEVLRWEHYVYTKRPENEFKLNNSLGSRYARKVIDEHPDLGALLQTRRLRAA
jgi:hypothetical protein